MILSKTNTDIFAKTVLDTTKIVALGGPFFLIRNRVYFKSGGNFKIKAYLDGIESEIGQHYDLVSKTQLAFEARRFSLDSAAVKSILAHITYDTRKVSVEML